MASAGFTSRAVEIVRRQGFSASDVRDATVGELVDIMRSASSAEDPGREDGTDPSALPAAAGRAGQGLALSAWHTDEDVALEDVVKWYSEALATLEALNRHGLDKLCSVLHSSWCSALVGPLDIDVFLLNHVRDARRAWVHKVIRATGFQRIESPNTTDADSLDMAALEKNGLLSPAWAHYDEDLITKKRYVAHALDYRAALQAAQARPTSRWVGIFEDDLILTVAPSIASARISAALQQLPPDADALYLEWCWDTCKAAQFHAAYSDVSVPYEPFCSAAILYTRAGLGKLIPQLAPVYTTIDDMITGACKAKALNCFKLRLPVFAQDLMWGSQFDPHKSRTNFHAIYRFFQSGQSLWMGGCDHCRLRQRHIDR